MKRFLFCLALVFVSGQTYALDAEFYTWNGFTVVVNAFTQLSLLFANPAYGYIVFALTVLGVTAGGAINFFKSIGTGQRIPLTWLVSVFLGGAVFAGLVIPTGTVHVYDPVKNQYQPVSDVPDIVVALAGTLNMVERLAVNVVEASAPFPYLDRAGGISFEMLLHSSKASSYWDNSAGWRSLTRYYEDCAPVAYSLDAYDAQFSRVQSGSVDLMVDLAGMASPAVMTTSYNPNLPNGKGGVAVTCEAAWVDYLEPLLTTDASFTSVRESVCESGAFDTTVAVELQRCEEILNGLSNVAYGVQGNEWFLFRHHLISSAIDYVSRSASVDDAIKNFANAQIMNDGYGVGIVAQEWLPIIRSVMWAVVLGITPLVLSLICTPVFPKASLVLVGLFVWLTLWGVCDAVIMVAVNASMESEFASLSQHGVGVEALLYTPSASMKALALLGKMRAMGATLSGTLVAMLFGISVMGVAGITQPISQNIDSKGSEAGDTALDQRSYANQVSSNENAYAGIQRLQHMRANGEYLQTVGAAQNYSTYEMGSKAESLMDSGWGHDITSAATHAAGVEGRGGAWNVERDLAAQKSQSAMSRDLGTEVSGLNQQFGQARTQSQVFDAASAAIRVDAAQSSASETDNGLRSAVDAMATIENSRTLGSLTADPSGRTPVVMSAIDTAADRNVISQPGADINMQRMKEFDMLRQVAQGRALGEHSPAVADNLGSADAGIKSAQAAQNLQRANFSDTDVVHSAGEQFRLENPVMLAATPESLAGSGDPDVAALGRSGVGGVERVTLMDDGTVLGRSLGIDYSVSADTGRSFNDQRVVADGAYYSQATASLSEPSRWKAAAESIRQYMENRPSIDVANDGEIDRMLSDLPHVNSMLKALAVESGTIARFDESDSLMNVQSGGLQIDTKKGVLGAVAEKGIGLSLNAGAEFSHQGTDNTSRDGNYADMRELFQQSLITAQETRSDWAMGDQFVNRFSSEMAGNVNSYQSKIMEENRKDLDDKGGLIPRVGGE